MQGQKALQGGLCDGSYMPSQKPGNIPRADVLHLPKTLGLCVHGLILSRSSRLVEKAFTAGGHRAIKMHLAAPLGSVLFRTGCNNHGPNKSKSLLMETFGGARCATAKAVPLLHCTTVPAPDLLSNHFPP